MKLDLGIGLCSEECCMKGWQMERNPNKANLPLHFGILPSPKQLRHIIPRWAPGSLVIMQRMLGCPSPVGCCLIGTPKNIITPWVPCTVGLALPVQWTKPRIYASVSVMVGLCRNAPSHSKAVAETRGCFHQHQLINMLIQIQSVCSHFWCVLKNLLQSFLPAKEATLQRGKFIQDLHYISSSLMWCTHC